MPRWMNPTLIFRSQRGLFFGNLQKYQHKEALEDLTTLGMTVEEFWQHDDKDYIEFEERKLSVPKQVHVKLPWVIVMPHP
jgi:hypothetical protein